MKASTFLAGLVISAVLAANAQGASVTQNFNSNWTAVPWDNNGDVAAGQWQYLNYATWDASLGTLQSVQISTKLSGTRDAADALSLRYAFFTGWMPNQYQFQETAIVAAGSSTLSDTRTFVSGTDFPLSNFLSYLYLPQAYYYFESRSDTTHSINAATELVFNYDPARLISEPASEVLMLAALSALAVAVRRRMPE
jgi:hypothetical protein